MITLVDPPFNRKVLISDDRKFAVNASFSDLLKKTNRNSAEAFWLQHGGRVLRDLRNRQNIRFQLFDGPLQITCYMKYFKASARDKNAYREWENLFRMRPLGLSVAEPLAYGELRDGSSFIATIEIPGKQLDFYLTETQHDDVHMQQIAIHLARYVRQMHDCGLHHQDLYLCHFYIDHRDDDFVLSLLDLDRMRYFPKLPLRWIAKDLGELHFSTDEMFLDRKYWKIFLEYYFSEKDFWLRRKLLCTGALIYSAQIKMRER